MRRLWSVFAAALLLVTLGPPVMAALPGDEPSTAIAVSSGTSTFDSSAMTESASDPSTCGPFNGFWNTMWLSYAPAHRSLTIMDVNSFVSLDGSTDFLAIVFVFAQHGTSLDLVGCNAFPSTVTFQAQAATTYLVMVGGLSAADTGEPDLSDRGGTFDLTITPLRGRVLKQSFEFSFTRDFPAGTICDFNYHEEATISGSDETFFDEAGNFVRDTVHLTVAVAHVNSDTGYTLTEVDHQSVTFVDATQTQRVVGVNWLLKDSTGRVVVVHAGLLIFDFTADEVTKVTPNFGPGFAEVLCPALGGNPA